MKRLALLLLALAAVIPSYSMMEVVVYPEKERAAYDYTITPDAIAQAKEASAAAMLSSITEINVSSKGFAAVLNDISLNAGSFEQTAIVLNGIKVNDPQTGHFNLDLAMPAINIASIAVANNADARAGSGGFTGIINVDAPAFTKEFFRLAASYGTWNTQYYGFSWLKRFDWLGLNASAERSSSDGYHLGTDYYKNTAYTALSFDGNHTLSLGYDEKAYGAYDFYTPAKGNNSWEYIDTKALNISLFKKFMVSTDIYYRSHYDLFVMRREDPAYYTNRHNTSLYGQDVKYSWMPEENKGLNLRFGLQREEMQSRRLGNHYRNRQEFTASGYFDPIKGLDISIAAAADRYDTYPNFDVMPTLSVAYAAGDAWKADLTYAGSMRYPNFTELYYVDPYNQGNPALKPERCNEFSGSASALLGGVSVTASGFYRMAIDLIDWGKTDVTQTVWKISNIGKVNTAGATVKADYSLDKFRVAASYTYLDSYRAEQFISKYGVTYLRNKLTASAGYELFGVKLNAEYLYKAYINREEAFHGLDITASYSVFDWLELTLKSENTLNWYFEETPGIPAMGRLLSVRTDINL